MARASFLRTTLPLACLSVCVSCAGDAGSPSPPTIPSPPPRGVLTVDITGLPVGTTAVVTVTGPAGYLETLTGSRTLPDLVPGTYHIVAQPILALGVTHTAADETVQVVADSTTTITIEYFGGAVRLDPNVGETRITGLAGSRQYYVLSAPAGKHVDFALSSVTPPWAVSVFMDLNKLPSTTSLDCTATCNAVSGAPMDYFIMIVGHVDYSVTLRAVLYDPATTAILDVPATGLPSGVAASMAIAGPDGFSMTRAPLNRIVGLVPGTYTVTSSPVMHNGFAYVPNTAVQSVNIGPRGLAVVPVIHAVVPVLNSGIPVSVSGSADSRRYYRLQVPAGATGVTFRTTGGTGNVDLMVRSGAPPDTSTRDCASATVSNDETCTFDAPVPGAWYLMLEGRSAYADVTTLAEYTTAAGTINLRIDAVQLNQGNQVLEGAIGGVSDRPGLLRVVASADAPNSLAPPVRIRLFQGPILLREALVPASGVGVPVAPNTRVLDQTWNLPLTAAEVVPGLAVEAVLDPDNTIATGDPSLKRFPRSGGAAPLDVQPLPQMRIVFIPVHASVDGSIGRVTTENMGEYLADARRWLPTAEILPSVRTPYTTSRDLTADVAQLLSEIRVLSIAEGGADRYYVGVFGTPNPSDAGGAIVPSSPNNPLRVAASIDRLPFAAGIVAHELGHLLGFGHSPCGTVGYPAFPHTNAHLGSPGYDIDSGVLRDPLQYFDFMSACGPRWVSDFTYSEMLAWRRADRLAPRPSASAAVAHARAPTPVVTDGLMLWGAIDANGPTLHPAFALTTRAVLPEHGGPNALIGRAADGAEIFRLSFEAPALLDGVADSRHFAFFLPLDRIRSEAVTRIELITPQGTAVHTMASAQTADDRVELVPMPGGALRMRWDGQRYPMAIVRDRASGTILSIARLGDADLRALPEQVEILASDGVKTRVLPVR